MARIQRGMSTDRSWSAKGWTADIVKNEDDDGWALAMTRDGDDEPVLVVPWVMGRNKKDPKPLNAADFSTQLKAARDFLDRSEHQRRAAHRRTVDVNDGDGARVRVIFDITPDEFEPQGLLVAEDLLGAELGRTECAPSTRLTRELATQWVLGGFDRVEEPQDW